MSLQKTSDLENMFATARGVLTGHYGGVSATRAHAWCSRVCAAAWIAADCSRAPHYLAQVICQVTNPTGFELTGECTLRAVAQCCIPSCGGPPVKLPNTWKSGVSPTNRRITGRHMSLL